MVFTRHLHENMVFNLYLLHLCDGFPAGSWSIRWPRVLLSNDEKFSYVTAKSISSYLGAAFDPQLVDLAKAEGLSVRYKQMLDLLEDPKTAIANLAVLKCVNETFFGEHVNENLDVGMLMAPIRKLAQEVSQNDATDSTAHNG